MIGINVEKIDKITQTNEMNLESTNESVKNILSTIDELEFCYSGKSLEMVFSDIKNQTGNFDKIIKQIEGYTTLFVEVKKSYQVQDSYMSSQSRKAS